MNCPNCGHAALPGMARCGHCNFKLPVNPKPQANAPDKAIPCWNCNHPNAAAAGNCERCNARIPARMKISKRTSVPAPARASFSAQNPENL